jgi:hypothetical protein
LQDLTPVREVVTTICRKTVPTKTVALTLLLIASSALTNVYPQTVQQIAKNAFTSTVLLVMEDANGQPLSLGSGFFVRDGEIATNLHVVRGASRGYAKLKGQRAAFPIEAVTATDARRDLVLLRVGTSGTALPLGDSNGIQVGDPVYAVGNPQGLEGTFSQGIVSSIRPVGDDRLLQITAPISPGSSGGPVLNAEGEVIGVAVATYKGGQNLNFAVPVSYLKVLLNAPTAATPLDRLSTSRRSSSLLADIGDEAPNAVIGTSFLWDYKEWGTPDTWVGGFTFSLKNNLREPVKDVYALVIFLDKQEQPLDFSIVRYSQTIPPNLARRVKGKVDGSVQRMTTGEWETVPRTRVEFRVLDFNVVAP